MLQLNVAVEGFLVCLFTAYQEVLSFPDCDLECVNNYCTCKPSKPTFDSSPPDWIIPVFAIFGLVVFGSCFLTLCTGCCKFCRAREVTGHTEEPTARISSSPPPFVIPVPSAPPANQFMEPPPYAEVSWKPYYYPPPMDQPPAYDNIAMGGLPPLDTSQPPGSVSRNS